MCLAVPGEIISISDGEAMARCGEVRFGEVSREVNLALVPEAMKGDYVLVHAGVAISVLSADAAERTQHYLQEIELQEIERFSAETSRSPHEVC